MNWGKSIILAFVLFGAFIATLVTVCVRQDVSLVSKDYYQEELAYQQQMERQQNAGDLEHKPEISVQHNQVQIAFDQFGDIKNAELFLFCPANANLDKKIKVESSQQAVQTIPVTLVPGMYKARFTWTMNEKDFYIEKIIQL